MEPDISMKILSRIVDSVKVHLIFKMINDY